MRSYRPTLIALLIIGLMVTLPLTAEAGRHPHERTGFSIGFNLGAGNSEMELSLGGLDLTGDRETGGAGNFRLGYAIEQNFLIGLEVSVWTKTYDVEGSLADLTVSYGIAGPSVTWFPGNSGFFLRAAVGSGQVDLELSESNLTTTAQESGFGGLAALGYEWRLTQKFALGAQLDLGYIKISDVVFGRDDVGDVTVNFANITAALNWYW
ncbi:MAG: outer membrane beta-barrel protein [Candidatus Eisenbacteria bacterium]|uniref:Outer membrane beta-barrel protein n=1 Tax=Eiseniibacteriota bacterium TaxID=2212470 RepID=A0A948RRW6_UNCEI|nr:outer membrane beta-barrel protein [Candidatus Eisenbacteria bacterium]MBU1948289.1 outer membrane beta-barrel protein [Candidatus Eisenbacteria bacterium]MBU2689855.1 outer membrane beta-barrel protein [Candidatus Eisenbacteria bacterium]